MLHRTPPIHLSFITTLLAPLASCTAQPEAVTLGNGELETRGYIREAQVWTSPFVDVCWENPTGSNASYRQMAQARILETWETVSGIEFMGWGTCTPSSTGIRITWEDTDPIAKVDSHGNDDWNPDEDIINMSLNHEYVAWPTANCAGSDKDACVRGHAVHEFGHAIGIMHEHARPDSTCNDFDGPNDEFIEYGAYDPDSVMNYCNDADDPELSAGDVATARFLYGPRRMARPMADFDADGFGDLVVGVPGENDGSGAIAVLYSDGSGVTAQDQLFLQGSAQVYGTSEPGDELGHTLAVGDFDGDGYSDLVAGAPGEAIDTRDDAGLINVLYGGTARLQSTGRG